MWRDPPLYWEQIVWPAYVAAHKDMLEGGDIEHGQNDYDALVSGTGCAGSADTLQCLRQVPFDTLQMAVDDSPGIFSPQVRVPTT